MADTKKRGQGDFRREPKPDTSSMILSRVPPQNVDAEKSVLGAMLLDKDAILMAEDKLTPEDFYREADAVIFKAILNLSHRGEPADILTVTEELKRMGRLDDVGGVLYINELPMNVISPKSIDRHADIVAGKAKLRRLIDAAGIIAEEAYSEQDTVEDITDNAEKSILEVTRDERKSDFTPIGEAVQNELEEISRKFRNKETITGIATGFPSLDALTSGFQKGDFIIVAARPSMGKTAFVLSMAKNMAVNFNTPVALFSLEMSNVQLVNRLIVNVCEIPGEKIKSGRLESYEWEQLDFKIKELYDAPIFVDDTPSLSVFELRTKARRLVREHGVKIIIIDYLQLMNASGMAFGSRQEEVSTISRSLKGLAKELNIPIVALSQLNRGVESREGIDGKRPQLSDLRESGAIEQDADMVCFIHRPEYYKIYQDDRGNDLRGMAEIVIAKHRNGAVGEVLLRFKGEFTRFSNPEDDMVIPMPGEPAGAMLGSKMNTGNAGSIPPPAPDFAPQTENPFGAPGDGPLPF